MSLKKTGIGWLVLFMGLTGFSQEEGGLFEGYERITFDGPETIYIDYNREMRGCKEKDMRFIWEKKKVIQFNLCREAVLLFSKQDKADTLRCGELPKYLFTTLEGVEYKYQTFLYLMRRKLPPTNTEKMYQAYGRNDVFETFLIVGSKGNRVIRYPVKWKIDHTGL